MGEPSRVVVPTRGPIEVRCDPRTAPRVARAALTRQLRGWAGLVALGGSSALGVIVTIGEGSWVAGLCYGLATLAAQAGGLWWSARRAARRAMPSHQSLVTGYEPSGLLSLTTGLGSSTFAPGSVDQAVRSSGLVRLRLLPSRQWTILPSDLLTDDDLAFLCGRRAAHPGATPDELPLMHVVTPESRRALQRCMVAHAWRGRQGRVTLGGLAFGAIFTAVVPDRVTFSLLALMMAVAAAVSAEAASRVRRQYPDGLLLHAAVTPAELVVEDREGRSTLPWTSFRSCTSTRDGVVLTLTTGQPIGLPRALFPPTELARLQQSVSRPRSP